MPGTKSSWFKFFEKSITLPGDQNWHYIFRQHSDHEQSYLHIPLPVNPLLCKTTESSFGSIKTELVLSVTRGNEFLIIYIPIVNYAISVLQARFTSNIQVIGPGENTF